MFGNNDGKKPPQGPFALNQNVTSHNQSGGITAHTVNQFAPPDRKLTDRDKREIAEMIPAGAKVRVSVSMGDAEAFSLGKEIEAHLVASGYDVTPDEFSQAVWNQPMRGKMIDKRPDGSYDVIIGSR